MGYLLTQVDRRVFDNAMANLFVLYLKNSSFTLSRIKLNDRKCQRLIQISKIINAYVIA